MRRRLRERKREREARLLDLGALVYELHRQGKRAPELLQEKAAELAVVDGEVRELEAALEGDTPVSALNGTAPPEPDPEPEAELDEPETHEADALEEPLPEDDEPEEELEGEPEDNAEARS